MNRGRTAPALGRIGEEAAAHHLKRQGYRILARNYRTGFAEVDLIVRRGTTLVFVEVKTRSSLRFGAPAEAISMEKQRRLSKAALDYMLQHNLEGHEARFDVVSVLLDTAGGPVRIEVLENAFDAIP